MTNLETPRRICICFECTDSKDTLEALPFCPSPLKGEGRGKMAKLRKQLHLFEGISTIGPRLASSWQWPWNFAQHFSQLLQFFLKTSCWLFKEHRILQRPLPYRMMGFEELVQLVEYQMTYIAIVQVLVYLTYEDHGGLQDDHRTTACIIISCIF